MPITLVFSCVRLLFGSLASAYPWLAEHDSAASVMTLLGKSGIMSMPVYSVDPEGRQEKLLGMIDKLDLVCVSERAALCNLLLLLLVMVM